MPITDPGPDAKLADMPRVPGVRLRRGPTPLWYAIVQSKALFPEASAARIAGSVKCATETVKEVLATSWARARLERSFDVRPHVERQLRTQALDALDYTGKAVRRGSKELAKPKPQAAVLNAATASAVKTLEGVGLFRQTIALTDSRTQGQSDFELLRQLASDPEMARQIASIDQSKQAAAPADVQSIE